MEEDAELEAIRAKLRRELMQEAVQPSPAAPVAPPALDRPVDLDERSFETFVRSQDNVVVDCWAPWCGPCRIVGPIVQDLAREMAGRVAFGKLDVDTAPAISQAFGIQSIPTLLVFRHAKLIDRLVGALPKQQLAAQLERHFSRRSAPGPRR